MEEPENGNTIERLYNDRHKLILHLLQSHPSENLKFPPNLVASNGAPLWSQCTSEFTNAIDVDYLLQGLLRVGEIVDLSMIRTNAATTMMITTIPKNQQHTHSDNVTSSSSSSAHSNDDTKPLPPIPQTRRPRRMELPPKPPSELWQSHQVDEKSSLPVTLDAIPEMTAFVTRDAVFGFNASKDALDLENRNPLLYTAMEWGMTDRELLIASWETLLLATRLLSDLSKDDLTTVLLVLRPLHKISDDLHEELMANLMLQECTRNFISTSTNPSVYIRDLCIPSDNLPEDLEQMKTLRFHWSLVSQCSFDTFVVRDMTVNKFDQFKAFRIRHAKVFYNGLLGVMRSSQQYKENEWEFGEKKFSNQELEYYIKDRIEQYLSESLHEGTSSTKGGNDNNALYPNLQYSSLDMELETLFNTLIEAVSLRESSNFIFKYPFNTLLYRPLMESCAFELLNQDDTSLSDSDSVDDDSSYDMDDVASGEFFRLLTVLKSTRHYLSISKSMERLVLIDAMFELFITCDDCAASEKLERLIIHHIDKFFGVSDDSREFFDSSVPLHRKYLLCKILHGLGSKLCDYLETYSSDIDLLQSHLKVYLEALTHFEHLMRMEKNNEQDNTRMRQDIRNVTSMCIRYMIRCTNVRNYERLKKSFENGLFDTATMKSFVESIKDEIDSSNQVTVPLLQPYLEDAAIENALVLVRPLIVDMAEILSHRDQLTMDIMFPLEIVKHILADINSHQQNEDYTFGNMRELSIAEILSPLSTSLTPLLDTWINLVQDTFSQYLDRAIQLEKWIAISNTVRYSASVIDLFSILEQNTALLYNLVFPEAHIYYRAFAQLVSGMVQRYTMSVVEGIPKPAQLIPSPPPIIPKKGRKRRNSVISAQQTSKIMSDEQHRLYLGQKFQYEELYVRLNNLNTARKKFNQMMVDIQQQWEFMRDNIFKTDTIASPDFESLTHGTNTFILNSIKDLANYIGTRNIFIEMQGPIFDELYLPTDRKSVV